MPCRYSDQVKSFPRGQNQSYAAFAAGDGQASALEARDVE